MSDSHPIPAAQSGPQAAAPQAEFPAAPWLRLAAAFYDGLLLLGIWVVVTMIAVPVCHAFGLEAETPIVPALRFLFGAAFFCWSWTHGGQTPGMLAWRLKVRRTDAGTIGWPAAVGRYAAMMATWALCLVPLLLLLPPRLLAHVPHPFATALLGTAFLFIALASTLLDGRYRAPCDRFSGSEVVRLPKKR